MPRSKLSAERSAAQHPCSSAHNVAGELDAEGDSGECDNSSAISPPTTSADACADVGLRLERKRQRELADVDLTSTPDEGGESGDSSSTRPADKTRRSDDVDNNSSRHAAAAAGNSGDALEATQPKKKQKGRTYHSRARAEQEVVPLAAPDKPPPRRCRRKSDEIYEEWEKADGRYMMTYQRPKESGQEASAAVGVRALDADQNDRQLWVVLALSNPKINASAMPLFPGGPRVYIISQASGHRAGLLFLPCGQALSQERLSDCALLFYVISGKVLVSMSLEDFGNKTACFGVNKGGTWEVPCRSTYSLKNGLSMTAQLVFWQKPVDDKNLSDRRNMTAGCVSTAEEEGIMA